MKKTSKLLAILLGAVSLFMFSGCALFERVSELMGPTDKFFYYEYPYDYDGSTIYFTCYMVYSENGKNFNKAGKTLSVDPGFTIFAVPSISPRREINPIEDLFGVVMDEYYIKKYFAKGEQISLQDNEGTSKGGFTTSKTTWAIIYNSVQMEDCGNSVPSELTGRTELTDLQNFKWEKLMYLIAINKLTDLANAE